MGHNVIHQNLNKLCQINVVYNTILFTTHNEDRFEGKGKKSLEYYLYL